MAKMPTNRQSQRLVVAESTNFVQVTEILKNIFSTVIF